MSVSGILDELHHFNELTAGEDERLALVLEECGEVVQIIGKILRHGYESHHPDNPMALNRNLLEKELGDVLAAIDMLVQAKDVDPGHIDGFRAAKHRKVKRYLHHQGTKP
jgi:NTP pyrophosphatase (non-canonical NTP hydrolase)